MENSGIYKIQSLNNSTRFYIGSALSFKKRWNTHLNSLRKGIHHSIQLQRHYDKYGESDLIFIILEPCFPQFLIIREQFYIDTLKPYFNTCKIAGSTLGYKYSKETVKEIQESRKWYKPTKDTCNKISKSLEGNKRSEGYKHRPESIEKIKEASTGENNPMFGKHHTESARDKQRKARLGKPSWNKGKKTGNKWEGKKHSPETILKMKKPKSEEAKQHMRHPHKMKQKNIA